LRHGGEINRRVGRWQGLDTSLARATDGYLADKLHSIGYPDWSFATILSRSPAGSSARYEPDGPQPSEMLSRSPH
jgi:hypothetical protein